MSIGDWYYVGMNRYVGIGRWWGARTTHPYSRTKVFVPDLSPVYAPEYHSPLFSYTYGITAPGTYTGGRANQNGRARP